MGTWLLYACPQGVLRHAPLTLHIGLAANSRADASAAANLETVAASSAMYVTITAVCFAAPLLVIGLVAVFRADPKDLPAVLDSLGKWVRRRSK